MGNVGDGWDRVPFKRIMAIRDIDNGAKLLLMALWTHADWGGPPGQVHGFTWASIATLAAETRESERTSRKRLAKLAAAGFVVQLPKVTQGELHIANAVRTKREIKPIKCSCKISKQPREWSNECSCRVLRPISESGTLVRDLPDTPLEIEGLHIARPRARVRLGSPPVPQGTCPPVPQGTGPPVPQGIQTSQGNQPGEPRFDPRATFPSLDNQDRLKPPEHC
jgi:Helix-turn-helix domain